MVAWFIAVFLLILLRYSVFCFTNSSVCHKDDSECLIPDTQKFGEILHGKCAKTAALRRIMNVDLLDCITECRLTSGCKSVSYRQTWKTCDLNSDTDKSYLSDEQGCQFTDVLTWPKVCVICLFRVTSCSMFICIMININGCLKLICVI